MKNLKNGVDFFFFRRNSWMPLMWMWMPTMGIFLGHYYCYRLLVKFHVLLPSRPRGDVIIQRFQLHLSTIDDQALKKNRRFRSTPSMHHWITEARGRNRQLLDCGIVRHLAVGFETSRYKHARSLWRHRTPLFSFRVGVTLQREFRHSWLPSYHGLINLPCRFLVICLPWCLR